jgi:hypothetical protein
MARTFTVTELEARIRRRSDTENDPFFVSAEIIDLIDSAYCKLYDLVVSRFQNYYLSSSSITSVSGEADYSLPADFYKSVGLDLVEPGGVPYTLAPFNFNERNIVPAQSAFSPTFRYLLKQSVVTLIPTPDAVRTFTLWYVPAPAKLTTGAQTVDGIAGWEEYVLNDACVAIRKKQDLDASGFEGERMLAEKRILEMAQERDAGFPKKVTDVTMLNLDRSLWRYVEGI